MADIEIICVGGEVRLVKLGDAAEILLLGGGDSLRLAVFESLFVSLGGELTGEDVIRLAAAVHKVERDSRKLSRSSALAKNDLVVVGNAQNLSEKIKCAVDYRLVRL